VIVLSEVRNKYFSMIPHIVDDYSLSLHAFRLYAHIKRRAGEEEGGACFESSENMARHCGMSKTLVIEAKKELVERGLIRIQTAPSYRGEFTRDVITLKNLQSDNHDYMSLEENERQFHRECWAKKSKELKNQRTLRRKAKDESKKSRGAHPVHNVDSPSPQRGLAPSPQRGLKEEPLLRHNPRKEREYTHAKNQVFDLRENLVEQF